MTQGANFDKLHLKKESAPNFLCRRKNREQKQARSQARSHVSHNRLTNLSIKHDFGSKYSVKTKSLSMVM
jgi:hypothetical protein